MVQRLMTKRVFFLKAITNPWRIFYLKLNSSKFQNFSGSLMDFFFNGIYFLVHLSWLLFRWSSPLGHLPRMFRTRYNVCNIWTLTQPLTAKNRIKKIPKLNTQNSLSWLQIFTNYIWTAFTSNFLPAALHYFLE